MSRKAGSTSVRRSELADQVEMLRHRETPWKEVARILNISPSYAQELYSDPDGAVRRLRQKGRTP